VTYNLADADDGSCPRAPSISSCLKKKSTINPSESMCYWTADHVDPSIGECAFRPLQGDLIRVVTIAMVSAVVSAPLALSVQYIVSNILSGETEEKSQGRSQLPAAVARISRRSTQRGNHEDIEEICGRDVSEDLHNLTRELFAYRKTLLEKERKIFDGDVE
jgi:hypothetical protein